MKHSKSNRKNKHMSTEDNEIPTQPTNNDNLNSSISTHPKPRKLMLALIILLFIIGLVLILSSNHKKTSPSTNLAKSTSAIINITSFGFSPSDINVPTNTIVTWTNKDTKPHEVAADPFPKDDSIPNFNSYVVLHTNETYTFKFEKSGTYKYHDQLNPFKFNGIVKVI